ncbi:hypothetical protein [uncultured Aquimarina sp.]|uniref:hypothetical protein n=1 Tax=uncultured Aquimarina sp. TaxID=575652 RepID=UPI0026195732|nr:hypothetical protein [uncultured Aquimarina sp.]
MTFKDYKKGVNKYYIQIKNDPNHELNRFLSEITPGKIKSASKIVFETKNGTQDILTVSNYFRVSRDKDFIKFFDNINADKFIPVKQFLEGTTKKPREEVVEFTAWLLDFQPRPYSEFRKKPPESVEGVLVVEEKKVNSKGDTNPQKKEESNVGDIKDNKPDNDKEEDIVISNPPSEIKKDGNSNRVRKIIITVSITLPILAIAYLGYNSQKKECMVWLEDHYEKADCNINGISINYNQDWIDNFKKVDNNTSIQVFFKEGGKPLYWYYKENNEIELFTLPGKHPENRKELKPITERIIRTHIFKE